MTARPYLRDRMRSVSRGIVVAFLILACFVVVAIVVGPLVGAHR